MKSFTTFLSEEKKESLKAVVKKHIETFSVSSKDLSTHIDKIAEAIQEEHFPNTDIEDIKKELKAYFEVNEIAIPMHMQFQQLIDNDPFSPYLEDHQKSQIHGDAMKFHELGHKYKHIAGFIKKKIYEIAHENDGEF